MNTILIGYLGLLCMLILVFSGVYLAYAMIGVSLIGMMYVMNFDFAAMQTAMLAWEKGTDSVFMCIPLFILMGQLVYRTHIMSDLFECVRRFFGHLPGGLAVAAVVACACFGAVTGSTIAATATMGSTIMPEFEKYGYDRRLASGTLAISGGLAAIIPPSVGYILYGVLTDTSIAALFIAGIIPGLLLTAGYSLYIVVKCIRHPEQGPRGAVFSWRERLTSLKGVIPIMVLFIIVVGGIYGGIFTPTEAAAIGVSGVVVIALCMGRLTWSIFKTAAKDAALMGTTIFFIILGGYMLARFLSVTGTTNHLVGFAVQSGINPYVLALSIMVLYLVLGCLLDSFGLTILTIPILFPIATAAGFDPIWFGTYTTLLIGLGTVTPPIGINVYVLHGVLPHIPSTDIFRGVTPLVAVHAAVTLLILIFPALTLWLPMTMN